MEEQVYLQGTIRDRLQDLIKSSKITQAELATRIGCSESLLSRFLSGKTDKLGDENIIRIARVFNVSTDFLLGETNLPDKLHYLNNIESLDKGSTRHTYVGDPMHHSPEQVYLAKERLREIHHALATILDRDRQYLHYRFGFHDDKEHPLKETARHFHLSTSRAAKTEKDALKSARVELRW